MGKYIKNILKLILGVKELKIEGIVFKLENGRIIDNSLGLKFHTTKANRYSYFSYKGKKYFEHIIVAKAYPEICGEWFEGCEVHHKDFNKLNNCANNLEIVSKDEHLEIHKSNIPFRIGMIKDNVLRKFHSTTDIYKETGIGSYYVKQSLNNVILKGKYENIRFVYL